MNSCPITFDVEKECSSKCYYFNLIDFPSKITAGKIVQPVSIVLSSKLTFAQKQFLHSILKVLRCPTVTTEPRKIDVEQQKKPTEILNEKPEIVVEESKTELQREEPKPSAQQHVQIPKSLF